MVRRLPIYALISACIFLAAPLVAGSEHLVHPAPWAGFLLGVLTFASQPPLSPTDLVNDPSDRRSALMILLTVVVANLVAVIQFSRSMSDPPGPRTLVVVLGIAIASAGMALRLWSIRTLGQFFTSAVAVQPGQPVLSTGPYRAMRHPSYTGTLLTTLGMALAFGSVFGVLLVALLVLPAYLYRIHLEERTLLAELGEAYATYRAVTPALVPTWRHKRR